MTSESKILTVSYGTFSCTLEGFDDPFNTMKAIAEYFRDLAAEDRYFGAEPPQPDAAMLHRIAEREVSRIVDTRVRDNAVVLRQQESAPAEPAPTVTPTRRITTRPRPSRDLSELAEKAEANFVAEEAAPEPTLQDVIPSGVAAKLARIRQSVNPPFVAADVADDALTAFAASDDLDAEVSPVETAFAAADDATFDDEMLADAAAPEDDAAGSDVLSRLGALMTDPVDLPDQADVTEFEPDTTADLADEADFDTAAPMVEMADDADASADVVEAQVDNWLVLDSAADAAAETADASLIDETAPAAFAEEDDAALLPDAADVLPEEAPAAFVTLAEALVEDPQPEAALDAAFEVDDQPIAGIEPAAALPEEPVAEEATADEPVAAAPVDEPTLPATKTAAKTKRVSSRVVRIHPDEDVAAPVERHDPNATRIINRGGEDEDFARLLRQADDVMADAENRRRLDSIAHLKAAVAATEADRAAGAETKPAPEAKQNPYRDDLAHVVQPDEPAPEPEVKPRRKTISVRPQEPRPGTIRPGMVSPPPLVLVSEQRIDRVVAPAAVPSPMSEPGPMVALRTGRLTGAIGIGAAAASPIMPHQKLVLEQPSRATSSEPDEDEDLADDLNEIDEAGLARFAEQVGVKSMADMLEAAAAYATCIENRSQFTRPQLMRRLMASAGGKSVSREEGLRSFGTLLRTGRIEKVSRGHYVLAEHSPYLTEARRLG
jgi:hypothetical protein